ncbi:MAG: cobalamin-binding protein [Bacteroidetes bacterium]|nr:cobalamin-binding protein [bacterium]NBP65086.1 cobalamin-binding protein [Bacteroidota bacterium]
MRIVCLTEETTETLYALGADEMIVGISGFTVRPAIARKTKPKVSTYLDAKIDEIIELKPDLVLAWSDLQASICQQLIQSGIAVHCFNHRTIAGILEMITMLGRLIDKSDEAMEYRAWLERRIDQRAETSAKNKRRPLIYFEEWYDPLISGIAWVSELIELCGGIDVFAEHRVYHDAKRRIIPNPEIIIESNPDIIIASWCGKGVKKELIRSRAGWSSINAIKNNQIHEIKSSIILQPGPAALTDGMDQISAIIQAWHQNLTK